MKQGVHQRRTHKVNGFSLMEVMVALLILSVGLLGLAGMQVSGLRGVSNSTDYTLASLALNDLAERMRANPVALDLGVFTGYVFAPATCTAAPVPYCADTLGADAASCTPSELATFDLYSWYCGDSASTGVANALANAAPSIICADIDILDTRPCTPGSPHIISITWTYLNERRDSNAGDTPETMSVNMRVLP